MSGHSGNIPPIVQSPSEPKSFPGMTSLGRESSMALPYLQLMRLDRPKALNYFLVPHLAGALAAAIITNKGPLDLLKTITILALGTLTMRGATCTWNDIADVDFDRQVARTRNRPLARGAVSIREAVIFTGFLSVLSLATLILLPRLAMLYAVPGIFGWYIYPLAKRFTNYPQVVLGFPMAWGVFMGSAALGLDPLNFAHYQPFLTRSQLGALEISERGAHALILLFCANALWTFCYETIYSYQDVNDDARAGVKNIALLLGTRRAKPSLALVALGVVWLLQLCGDSLRAGPGYYAGALVNFGLLMGVEIWSVDLHDPKACHWWFINGGLIGGFTILQGFVVQYVSVQVAK